MGVWDEIKKGPEDPFVKAAINGKTPNQAASDIISGTKHKDQKLLAILKRHFRH